MTYKVSTAEVIDYAVAGLDAEAFAMSTEHWTPGTYPRYGYREGWLPDALKKILRERHETITQVVYSYQTPIAWEDDGVWIKPDVYYSSTTSAKHQPKLYTALPRLIPADAGIDEYLQVLKGETIFSRGHRVGGIGSYRAA